MSILVYKKVLLEAANMEQLNSPEKSLYYNLWRKRKNE